MEQQPQNSEMASVNEVISTPSYSLSRRIFAVVLVLIAALLLGYVLYSNLMQEAAPAPVPEAAIEPELTEQEIAIQRLESLQNEGTVEVTAEMRGRLEAVGGDTQPPDEAAVARLESLQ